MKKIKFYFTGKRVKSKVIPFILFIFGLYLTAQYIINSPGVTVLAFDYPKEIFKDLDTSEIHAQEKVFAEFESEENYLGIVAVRFNTYGRINDDTVVFRIKEKGQEGWYYENIYKVDQFQPNQHFTFGLPPISNSMGKIYQFEIESRSGEKGNAVALSDSEPVVVTKHQYPRSIISENIESGVIYLWKKVDNLFFNYEFPLLTALYFLPLLGYILWNVYFERYLANKLYFVFIVPVGLFIESVFVNNSNDIAVLILSTITLAIFLGYRLMSRVTFLFALLFLILTPIFLAFNNEFVAENFAMWAYLLMVIGIIQALIELKRGDKGLVNYDEFLRKALPLIRISRKKK